MTHEPEHSANEHQRDRAADLALWHLLQRDTGVHIDVEDDLLIRLASFVDGNASPSERAEIERLLASHPALVALLPSELEMERGRTLLVTQDVLDRASLLVEDREHIWTNRLLSKMSWAGAVAACLAICLLGYQAGSSSRSAAVPTTGLVSEMSFGVLDDGSFEEIPAIDFLLHEDHQQGGDVQ